MLLHGREAHRVVAGQLGDPLLAVDRAAHDVAAGVVRQGAEHAVEVGWGELHWYNHTVVQDALSSPLPLRSCEVPMDEENPREHDLGSDHRP